MRCMEQQWPRRSQVLECVIVCCTTRVPNCREGHWADVCSGQELFPYYLPGEARQQKQLMKHGRSSNWLGNNFCCCLLTKPFHPPFSFLVLFYYFRSQATVSILETASNILGASALLVASAQVEANTSSR